MALFFYRQFPLLVFMGIWALCIGLYSLGLFNIRPVSMQTWILLYSGIAAVAGGYILMSVYLIDSRLDLFKKAEVNTPALVLNEKRLANLVLFLFFMSCTGAVICLTQIAGMVGGVEKYVSSPLEVRNTITGIQQNPLVAPPLAYRLGNYMMSVGFVGSILGGILITGTTWKKYMGLLPLVAALIPAILYFSRYVFVNSITFWWLAFLFTSFFYRRERTKKLLIRLFVTSVAVLAFTLSFSYFIFSARNAMWGDFQDAFFETLYVYFAGNIAAFDVFLFEDTALYYGQQTFRTIITWLARLNIWNPGSVHSVHQPFVVISSTQAINTYTFVQTFYGDFGITGTLFLSGLWGAGTRYAVYKYMQKFSFIRLGFVLVMSFSLIMSFYGFYLSNLTTIVFWLVVLYLSDYISGKDVLYSIQ